MMIARWFRHLTMTRWQLRRRFPESALQAITEAVRASEHTHGGEIRVAIEGDWHVAALWRDITPRQRALQLFSELQVWDTAQRNGVLIYLSLADRDVEIIADRGLNDCVAAAEWRAVCQNMETALARGEYQSATCEAVVQVGALLARTFPHADRNEQPDRPVLL